MSDRQFLPDSDDDYAIPQRNPDGFTEGKANLLQDIGQKMNVNLARSEGRIPSPFSRAYLFYLNFFATGLGEGSDDTQTDRGRELLQKQARRTFRGIAATFALREALDLNIELHAVDLSQDGEPVEALLRPATIGAPRDPSYWNPVRFYTVQSDADASREVLAGQSPLTGLYPAASPPSGLNSLYWYDSSTGTWYDPTSDDLGKGEHALRIADKTKTVVRRLLKSWIEEAIRVVDPHDALQDHGLTSKDQTLLQKELEAWHDEITVPAWEEPLVDSPIPSQDAPRPGALPFLDKACPKPKTTIASDLPVHEGRLLVRKQDLVDNQVRLFGRLMGSREHRSEIADLGAEGSNLGRDLGIGEDTLPNPYLFVNELFVPKLTPLTSQDFSKEWDGLKIDGEQYLLPFRPEILNLMSPRELVAQTSAEVKFDDSYEVSLDFGKGAPVSKRYVEKGDDEESEYVVDAETIPPETFDLRLFPNFKLDAVSERLPKQDRKYYARVRLAPEWDFRIGALHHDEVEGVAIDGNDPNVEKTRVGNFEETVPGDKFSRGEALFITCDEQPDGFYVENHGLCIVELPTPSNPKQKWEVGIDFGTSNTCVSYRPADPAGNEEAQVMDLPVFTTTLFENPELSAEFENPYGTRVNERASALLDFFYRQSKADETLNPQSYFPTQFVTRHSEVKRNPDWEFENGLIYFQNIGLGGAIDVQELIDGYPEVVGGSTRKPKRDFKAKQNLKWSNTEWLDAFMRHLRKHVALTAAYQNAEITDLKFSYPKAFTTTERSRFNNVLDRAWSDLVEHGSATESTISLSSEAEAIRNRFVKETGAYVILDVGGGTTDVIAFHDNRPIFQTSYRAAAGLINDYVATSTSFRIAFLEAMEKVLGERYSQILPRPLEKKFQEGKGTDESVIKTVWIGLLTRIEQENTDLTQVLHELRDPASNIVEDEATEKAVQGFFLSVALLFTGSVFNAGVLLHAASQGVFSDGKNGFDPEFTDLKLTGNGSKLLGMLHESTQPFDPVLQKALYAGIRAAGDQAPSFEVSDIDFRGIDQADEGRSPKVSVSLGLLDEAELPSGDSGAGNVPVANIVAESGYDENGLDGAGEDLIRFYEGAHENGFKAPTETPDLFGQYLEALNEMLPRGNNEGAHVLPGVGPNWHEGVREEIYPDSRRIINTRVKKNAAELVDQRDNFDRDDIPALESLFVVQLRSLIEQVRKDFAG